MRSAKETENFPYAIKNICYFLVDNNGKVERVHHFRKCDRQEVINAYEKIQSGTAILYAVWSGQYTSDLFIIDDIKLFGQCFEL